MDPGRVGLWTCVARTGLRSDHPLEQSSLKLAPSFNYLWQIIWAEEDGDVSFIPPQKKTPQLALLKMPVFLMCIREQKPTCGRHG